MAFPDWEDIYQTYSGKVMGYILARVRRREDAEDLCADVFEKVFRKLGEYDRGKSSLNTWIFTITRNTVIDYFRRTRPTEEPDENLASDEEIDEGLLTQETLSELAGALAKLPEEKRAGLLGVLAQDPRPHYQNDPERVYGLDFAGLNVRFRVDGNELTVVEVEE